MNPPTKFEQMRANRLVAESQPQPKSRWNEELNRNAIETIKTGEYGPILPYVPPAPLAEPTVPTMEIDGVRYRQEVSDFLCTGCAFFPEGRCCTQANETAQSVFGTNCHSGRIYIRADTP